jgi:hypothetical protein
MCAGCNRFILYFGNGRKTESKNKGDLGIMDRISDLIYRKYFQAMINFLLVSVVAGSHQLYSRNLSGTFGPGSEKSGIIGEIFTDMADEPLVAFEDYWVPAGSMHAARRNCTATLLQNGQVLITGWFADQAELYDPATGTFILSDTTIASHMYGAAAALLNDGRVLLTGGYLSQKTAEIYDPANGQFSLTGEMLNEHSYHRATLLNDGRVLITGGQDQMAGPMTHAVCEIYDPQAGSFSLTGGLNEHRSGHTATLLPDGRVLITGGSQTDSPGIGHYLTACEMYDPETGVFSRVQDLHYERMEHQAVLLKNGLVLVVSGAWDGDYGELYDYNTDEWTLTGSMTEVRRNNITATRLRNGKVLIAGGYFNSPLQSAEIYDPESNTFIITGNMQIPRIFHQAVLLQDGSVLVVGGWDGIADLASAERYLVDSTTVVHTDHRDGQERDAPASFFLSQNYPNPFNPVTTIRFTMKEPCRVELKIYDIRGREVAVLADENYDPGSHAVHFDASGLPGGIYFYQIRMGNHTSVRKMAVIE